MCSQTVFNSTQEEDTDIQRTNSYSLHCMVIIRFGIQAQVFFILNPVFFLLHQVKIIYTIK